VKQLQLLRFLLSSTCLLCTAGLAAQQSFSAHYRYVHQPSDTLLDEALVLVSDAGIRVEQLLDDSGNVFIANYETGRYWFLDQHRQVVHEVPFAADDTAVEKDRHEEEVATDLGFVQFSPCAGMDALMTGTETWHGRTVQHWTCTLDAQPVAEHWFAVVPGIVVRTSDHEGYVQELVDIRDRPVDAGDLLPPLHFRAVSIEELINPIVPISSYVEKQITLH
jgi:hypothetical protein